MKIIKKFGILILNLAIIYLVLALIIGIDNTNTLVISFINGLKSML